MDALRGDAGDRSAAASRCADCRQRSQLGGNRSAHQREVRSASETAIGRYPGRRTATDAIAFIGHALSPRNGAGARSGARVSRTNPRAGTGTFASQRRNLPQPAPRLSPGPRMLAPRTLFAISVRPSAMPSGPLAARWAVPLAWRRAECSEPVLGGGEVKGTDVAKTALGLAGGAIAGGIGSKIGSALGGLFGGGGRRQAGGGGGGGAVRPFLAAASKAKAAR